MPIPPLHEFVLRYLPTHDNFFIKFNRAVIRFKKGFYQPQNIAVIINKMSINVMNLGHYATDFQEIDS